MAKPTSSQKSDAREDVPVDGRTELLDHLRALIPEADPEIIEEVK